MKVGEHFEKMDFHTALKRRLKDKLERGDKRGASDIEGRCVYAKPPLLLPLFA